jgi:hypothetical protein
MGADEEGGKNAGSHAARSAVLLKYLSGQEQRWSRCWHDVDHRVRKQAAALLAQAPIIFLPLSSLFFAGLIGLPGIACNGR